MTYNVFSGTLNLTQPTMYQSLLAVSLSQSVLFYCLFNIDQACNKSQMSWWHVTVIDFVSCATIVVDTHCERPAVVCNTVIMTEWNNIAMSALGMFTFLDMDLFESVMSTVVLLE